MGIHFCMMMSQIEFSYTEDKDLKTTFRYQRKYSNPQYLLLVKFCCFSSSLGHRLILFS